MNKSITLNPVHVVIAGVAMALVGLVVPGFLPLVFYGLAIAVGGIIGLVFSAINSRLSKGRQKKGEEALKAKYLLLAAGISYLISFGTDGVFGAVFGTIGFVMVLIGLVAGISESIESRKGR